MRPRDLQDFQEDGVRHLAQEMHAREINPVADLVQDKVLPALAALRRAAIADLVAPDDHNLRLGSFGQHRRQGAHEDVVAAIGLQIAVHKGQNLVTRL